MLVCGSIILILAIKNYLDKGEPMYTQLCIVFAITQIMIQRFKPIFIHTYLKLSNDQKSSDQVISELIKKKY